MRTLEIAFDEWEKLTKLVFLGDAHLGNADADEKLISDVVTRLGEPGCYWLDLGDSIEAINVRDRRFEPALLPDWVGARDLVDLAKCQVARYKHHFGQAMGNCLVRLEGNHEDTLKRIYERDVYNEINQAIGLPPERALGYSGFLRLRFRERAGTKNKIRQVWTVTIFLHHGAGGGQLAGAKALRLERMPMAYDADVFAIGHTHTKIAMRKRRIGMSPKSGQIEARRLIMLNVGSFLDGGGGSGYAERGMLYPQELGPIELWFSPSEKKIKVVE